MIEAQNATGWAELYNGTAVKAAYTLYNTAMLGWSVGILFLVFQTMLAIKVRNPVANFLTSLIFASLYIASSIIQPQIAGIMLLIIVIELAGILYLIFIK